MNNLLIFLTLSFFTVTFAVSTNCNASMGRNVLALDYDYEQEIETLELQLTPQECVDANLCIEKCLQNKLISMKIDLQDPTISSELKSAYLAECMWDLTRDEIEGKVIMEAPRSRGQYISQFIAKLSLPFVTTLPKTPEPRVRLLLGKGMSIVTYETARVIAQDPIKFIKDWEDFMIYVSHSFTLFKDIAKYTAILIKPSLTINPN